MTIKNQFLFYHSRKGFNNLLRYLWLLLNNEIQIHIISSFTVILLTFECVTKCRMRLHLLTH